MKNGEFLPQFVARAIIDLRQVGKQFKKIDPQISIACLGTAEILLRAKCFVLPVNGEIYRSNEMGGECPSAAECESTMGLPAPVCALEYAWNYQLSEAERLKIEAAGRIPSIGRKRITLVVDRKEFLQSIGIPPHDKEAFADLISITYLDGFGWVPTQHILTIPIPVKVCPVMEASKKTWGLDCCLRDFVTGDRANEQESCNALGEWYADVTALVQMCHALRAGARLKEHTEKSSNRRRIFEAKGVGGIVYHTLVLPNQKDNETAAPTAAAVHASPRHHFRRGHIRNLPTGALTWVRHCFVGNPAHGEVRKSYKMAHADPLAS